jgi:hypothetical protein
MSSGDATEEALDGDASCDCKVGRVLSARGLEELDEELAARWAGEDGGASLRELEAFLNRRVLAAAMREAGMSPLDGEAENAHRILTDDEVSSGVRTELRRRLERAGVDIEGVESQFVSHQTIHTHLRGCRGLSTPTTERTPAERREAAADTVAALGSRTEAVTRGALERLREDDAISLDGFDVLIDVSVTCDSCGRVTPVRRLLVDGGCACQTE